LRRHFAQIAYRLNKKFAVPHTSLHAELGGQWPEGTIAKIVMRWLHALYSTLSDFQIYHQIWFLHFSSGSGDPNNQIAEYSGDPNNQITKYLE
jgi:hypothetical protein